ncbi:S-layer homology domain-containing protein [Paenibacillus sp. TAF43_2]|uniref:S-layer homology domain-containing protein n=2 Tax=unclassified Paenibacillus TaxID=185978 RepID=UPI003F9898B4
MKKCKRFMSAGLIILLLAMALPSFAFAADTPVFALTQEKSDKDIRIVVTADKLTDMYAYEVKLSFDAKKLRFKSASSSIAGFSISPIVEGNQIVFAATKIGNKAGENGKSVLSSFLFEPIGNGDTEVLLTDAKLVKSTLDSSTLKPNVKLTANLGNSALSFKDIAEHWAIASIERAVQLGFVNGYTDGTFKPNAQVTRAEFAAMLVRALDLKADLAADVSFKDAGSIPSWASAFVGTAVKAGIITGYEDNTFRPSKPINRAEIAVMVVRALEWKVDQAKKSSFADRSQIPAWAEPSVAMAAEAGIIKGRGENKFAPSANATRAEAVTLLLALIDTKQ